MTPRAAIHRLLALLPLLLIPAVLIAIATARFTAQGPFWAGSFYDPEYPYLFNALNFLQGRAPWHIDHPGTPLQLLLALLIGIRYQLAGSDDSLRREVLLNPEPYLRAGWLLLLTLTVAALTFFGWAARRLTRSTAAAILGQVAILTSGAVVASLTRVNPEPLLLAFALLLAATGFCLIHREVQSTLPPLPWWRGAPAAGALLGIAIAAKITFAPLALAALFLRRGLRFKILLTLTSVAALLVSVGPIASQHQRITTWLSKLFWGSARYGTGNQTIINRAVYPRAFKNLLLAEPVLAAAIALSILALLIALPLRRRLNQRSRSAARLLLGITLAQAAALAMVAKMPDPRYLVPASALVGANLILLWTLASSLPRLSRWAACLLLAAALAFAGYRHYRALCREHAALIHNGDVARRSWEAHASLPDDALIIVAFRSSSPPMALIFGDGWAGGHRQRLIDELYPRYIVQIREHRYRRGSLDHITPAQIHALAAEQPVFLHTLRNRPPTQIPTEPHLIIDHEAIFRVLPPTAPAAAAPASAAPTKP